MNSTPKRRAFLWSVSIMSPWRICDWGELASLRQAIRLHRGWRERRRTGKPGRLLDLLAKVPHVGGGAPGDNGDATSAVEGQRATPDSLDLAFCQWVPWDSNPQPTG